MELTIEKSDRDLDVIVREMCEKLLANTVIEDFSYEVQEVVTK
jgi:phosphoribosylformylglycinamidine synthase